MTVQVGFGPLERIDGPPPLAPLYGLLQSAQARTVRVISDDVDVNGVERWLNGVQVFPYPPDLPDAFDTCTRGSDAAQTKGFGADLASPIFGAFTAFLAETCTSYKVWNQEEYKARAVAALTAAEGYIVEAVLMGTSDRLLNNPHLADGEGNFPRGDDLLGVTQAFAVLDSEILASGKQGLIHVSPRLHVHAKAEHLIELDSSNGGSAGVGVWRSPNGNVVVPGSGYQQLSPDKWASGGGDWQLGPPAPAGQGFDATTVANEWMYASGPVDVHRTEVFTNPDNVLQATDRGTGGASEGRPNSITYRAERYYLVDWDTELQSAVRVNLCTPDCH